MNNNKHFLSIKSVLWNKVFTPSLKKKYIVIPLKKITLTKGFEGIKLFKNMT